MDLRKLLRTLLCSPPKHAELGSRQSYPRPMPHCGKGRVEGHRTNQKRVLQWKLQKSVDDCVGPVRCHLTKNLFPPVRHRRGNENLF